LTNATVIDITIRFVYQMSIEKLNQLMLRMIKINLKKIKQQQ
jgi:hypothetical protein